MVVYQILFSAGRLRKIKFNISKNNFIRSGEWGNTLWFEKLMIKKQFEKGKTSDYIWGGHGFEWEISYVSIFSSGIF